jgi:hypothetical protein
MVKGFAEDDAEMLARQVVGENRAGRVLERDVALTIPNSGASRYYTNKIRLMKFE